MSGSPPNDKRPRSYVSDSTMGATWRWCKQDGARLVDAIKSKRGGGGAGPGWPQGATRTHYEIATENFHPPCTCSFTDSTHRAIYYSEEEH